MNGIHDMGGMHWSGPLPLEEDEPTFHAPWEGRVLGITLMMDRYELYNGDEHRYAIERMPAERYLTASYYERWLTALETLLVEKGVLAKEELEARVKEVSGEPSHAGTPHPARSERQVEQGAPRVREESTTSHQKNVEPSYGTGDRVITRTINPRGHTRLPRYVRGKQGVVMRHQGSFVFPDAHAQGQGAHRHPVYSVRFEARELWGDDAPAGDAVYIDLWENYLTPAETPVSQT